MALHSAHRAGVAFRHPKRVPFPDPLIGCRKRPPIQGSLSTPRARGRCPAPTHVGIPTSGIGKRHSVWGVGNAALDRGSKSTPRVQARNSLPIWGAENAPDSGIGKRTLSQARELIVWCVCCEASGRNEVPACGSHPLYRRGSLGVGGIITRA